MNNYTIYCTESQVKKALELGAPIHSPQVALGFFEEWELEILHTIIIDDEYYDIPTAEQMIGWLEKQGIIIDTISEEENENEILYLASLYKKGYQSLNKELILYPTRKEATLAGINKALDYLIEQKKNKSIKEE